MNALQSVSKRFEPLKGGARNAHDYVNGGHVIMLSVQCQHLVSNEDEMSNGPSAVPVTWLMFQNVCES